METCNFCEQVKKWFNHPYKEDGSVVDWFLFFGLVVIVSFIWTRILARLV